MFKDYLLEHGFRSIEDIGYFALSSLFDEMYVDERIKARKERASFDGTSIDYDSLCKFRVYNEQGTHIFIPRLSRMNGKKLSKNFKEVDLTTIINIGIAECFSLLDMLFKSDNSFKNNVCRYLYFNYPVVADDTTYLKLAFCKSSEFKDTNKIFKDQICIEHYSLGEFMYRFKPENTAEMRNLDDIRYYLDALAYYNVRSYTLVLGDLLAFLMCFRELLFDLYQNQMLGKSYEDSIEICRKISKCKGLIGSTDNYYNRFSNKDFEELYEDSLDLFSFGNTDNMTDELNFGSMRYRYEDNVGRISDARQLAIALVGVLGYGYLSCSSNTPINFLNLDYLQFKINQCLGDDVLAKIVTCTATVKKDNSFVFSDWRKSVDTDICKYEEFVVWKKYNKSSLKWEDFSSCSWFNPSCCGWTSHYRVDSLIDFILLSTAPNVNKNLLDNLDKYDDTIKRLNKELASLKLSLSSRVKEPVIDNSIIEKKDSVIDGLKKQIEELERINASKSDIIANKSNEIDSLNNEIAKIFCDDYIPEESALEVSQEDKITFLNDFNFVFVNGLVGFEKSLQNIGITNYRIINTCGTSMNISQSYKADFVIYCTNFISHAVCNSVKSVYGSQAEGCYYTGTNIDKMVDFMYDYVNNYLNS